MAGKIIVYATTQYIGLTKCHIFLNGERVASLGRGEQIELQVNKDSYVYAKIGPNPKGDEVLVKANAITKLTMSVNKLSWRADLKIASETPIEQYSAAEDIQEKPIYDLKGARGRYLKVYEDKCIIGTKVSVGSFITRNVSDGEKTIYYCDVLGVQYKRSGLQLGYLQLETASSTMNNRADNFFNENSFTFENELDFKMDEVQKFVKQKVDEAKRGKNSPSTIVQQASAADELLKFKQLLDAGIITQEEFDAKKKQLLGL